MDDAKRERIEARARAIREAAKADDVEIVPEQSEPVDEDLPVIQTEENDNDKNEEGDTGKNEDA